MLIDVTHIAHGKMSFTNIYVCLTLEIVFFSVLIKKKKKKKSVLFQTWVDSMLFC